MLHSEPDPSTKEALCKEEIGLAICCLSYLEGRVKGESEYRGSSAITGVYHALDRLCKSKDEDKV